MNYIKYKDQAHVNLDNVFAINKYSHKIYFIPTAGEVESSISEEWNFNTVEERDRVLALIDDAVNCKDLTLSMEAEE